MMVGTVATVPTVKRAVHHLTAPRHHVVARHGAGAAPVNCDPVGTAALPAVPLVTYAAPIPPEPGGTGPGGATSGGTGGGAGPILGALAGGAPAALAGGGLGSAPTPSGPGAVPEPTTWLMMIAGIGAIGAALRRRRQIDRSEDGTGVAGTGVTGTGVSGRGAAGTALWSGMAVDAATTLAARSAVVKSTAASVAGKSTATSVAGKALLCVCPAVVAAGGVMAVPPLRHAVHAYTAPPLPAAGPCIGTTVPVSTTSLNGFPASVSTVPASVPATATATATATAKVPVPAAAS